MCRNGVILMCSGGGRIFTTLKKIKKGEKRDHYIFHTFYYMSFHVWTLDDSREPWKIWMTSLSVSLSLDMRIQKPNVFICTYIIYTVHKFDLIIYICIYIYTSTKIQKIEHFNNTIYNIILKYIYIILYIYFYILTMSFIFRNTFFVYIFIWFISKASQRLFCRPHTVPQNHTDVFILLWCSTLSSRRTWTLSNDVTQKQGKHKPGEQQFWNLETHDAVHLCRSACVCVCLCMCVCLCVFCKC